MPQDVSQFVSWSLSYYPRSLDALLNKEINFELTENHVRLIQEMFNELSSDEALAFPESEAAISGSRTFRLDIDASGEGLGVVLEKYADAIEDKERHMYSPAEHHVPMLSSGEFRQGVALPYDFTNPYSSNNSAICEWHELT